MHAILFIVYSTYLPIPLIPVPSWLVVKKVYYTILFYEIMYAATMLSEKCYLTTCYLDNLCGNRNNAHHLHSNVLIYTEFPLKPDHIQEHYIGD